jgi:hypothetical protein
LNDLLKEAGEKGKQICYIVNKLTWRKDKESYSEYMDRVLEVNDSGLNRALDIVAIIIKLSDRVQNTLPFEERGDVNEIVKEYTKLNERKAPEKEFMEFYKKHKVLDYFRQKANYKYDVNLLVKALNDVHDITLESNSWDNLGEYVGKPEELLLSRPKENDKLVYNPDKLRSLIKKANVNSLKIFCSHLGVDPLKAIKIIQRTAHYRGSLEVKGYPNILEEIKEEVIAGTIFLSKSF